MIKTVLFLGYTREETKLHDILISRGLEVFGIVNRLTTEQILTHSPCLVISYGYRHILSQELIDAFRAPVINMHISFLPHNRGAHPNFWAFYDNTPHGVTIHEMDAGIDTGPIIVQKQVKFAAEELSFSSTYQRLTNEIESLFIENVDEIVNLRWSAKKQTAAGSYHATRDLPEDLCWDMDIKEYLLSHNRPIPNDAWE